MRKWLFLLSCCFTHLLSTGQTVELTPLKDNTIFSENSNASSGAGTDIYIGRTGSNANNTLRRGLLQFDLGPIPANAIISSVTLTVNCTKAPPAGSRTSGNIGLYVAKQSWGEGTSVGPAGAGTQATNGDATWTCRFYNGIGNCNQPWLSGGADYYATISSVITVDDVGIYTFGNTDAMIADIKRWVDTPSLNFGWVLIGDEANSFSTRAFTSKEHVQKGSKLTVSYTLPACTENTWTGAINNAWETAGNWSCNMVPDNTMNVIINGGTVELNSNAVVKTLQLSNGANFTAKPGFTLTILQ